MEKTPVVGLPKGLFYYDHGSTWERFLTDIGCKVIPLKDTNKDILD